MAGDTEKDVLNAVRIPTKATVRPWSKTDQEQQIRFTVEQIERVRGAIQETPARKRTPILSRSI